MYGTDEPRSDEAEYGGRKRWTRKRLAENVISGMSPASLSFANPIFASSNRRTLSHFRINELCNLISVHLRKKGEKPNVCCLTIRCGVIVGWVK